ncbi:MAG TPA: hypothetical protein DD727_09040 [Clostridiales bacterium]|nr:hypothetical protein [Clostridiales bacterium]
MIALESYEEQRSIQQDLTFVAAEAEFTLRSVAFGAAQMATLGFMNADHIYTNLGFILSDECVHIIKTAVFQDV